MPNEKIDFSASIRFELSIVACMWASQSITTSVADLIGCDEKETWDFLTAKEQEEELQVCLFDWQNKQIESNWRII